MDGPRRGSWAGMALILVVTALLVGNVPVAPAWAAPGEWWADYFDNPTLSGAPVLSRFDDEIKFGWGDGSPSSKVPRDNFSVRWVRDEWFAGGTYRFSIYSDDGIRIWVGDQLVVDEWRDRWATLLTVDRAIPAGTHRVRVEYYEHTGAATISVSWHRLVGGATWRAEYFANRELEGWPVLVRDDGAIDFDWGSGSPDPAVPADNFSVRWTHTLAFDAGTYRFLASTDDGVRIWVDGGLVIDAWEDQMLPETHTGELYLSSGQHTVAVEYYEHGGDAAAHVWWQPLASYAAWHGEYFANRTLTGGPALVRGDAANCGLGGFDFDWGVGAPAEWMPDDNFSVRWTRTADFAPGYYRFVVLADDGVRVWIDDNYLIDQWHEMDYELHYVDGTYLQGRHTIRVEYFERNGRARIRFWWEPGTSGNAPPASLTPTVLADPAPSARPAAADPPTSVGPWAAAYFANTDLSGEPVLARTETALDHNWGFGSPGSGVPEDHFSVRWTQTVQLDGGLYRFTTYTDDGVRLWIDGRLAIEAWRPMRASPLELADDANPACGGLSNPSPVG